MALLDCVSKLELGAEVGRCVVSKYFGSNGGIRKQCSIFVSIVERSSEGYLPRDQEYYYSGISAPIARL